MEGRGSELSKLTPACSCGEAARTDLNTRLLAVPGGLGKVLFGGTVFRFSLTCILMVLL